MDIIVDYREARSPVAIALSRMSEVMLKSGQLNAGDYLIDGRILFERKNAQGPCPINQRRKTLQPGIKARIKFQSMRGDPRGHLGISSGIEDAPGSDPGGDHFINA